VIAARDVVKHFESGLIKALNGVSFRVEAGEIVALMGPSGCGKSTLLNLIGTLDAPTSGEIWIEGKPIGAYRSFDRFRATTVGFVFQHHHLIPSLTLLENVETPMCAAGAARGTRRRRAAQLLEEMGLATRMHAFPTGVSGGERQRAALARALANAPKIILADEPTGSIDTETGRRILEGLVARCRRETLTMVIATHNEEVAAMADRRIFLRDGRIETLSR